MKRHLIILACIVCAHCGEQPAATRNNPPKYDYSTPDRFVESVWANKIWSDTSAAIDDSEIKKMYSQETISRIQSYREKELLLKKKNHPWLHNQIIRVSIESDSRAVVDVREKISYSKQDEFDNLTYVLSRENGQWRISDLLHECSICDGTGKKRDYSRLGGGMIECNFCKGRGKRSMILTE